MIAGSIVRAARRCLPALALASASLAPAATPVRDYSITPPGLSASCQKAYQVMFACIGKLMASGAPPSVRVQWERQMDDTVKMWRAMRGQSGVDDSCQAIARDPGCSND